MADEIELRFDTRELDAALKALPAKLRGALMAKALQAGGDVMLDAMVEETPERTDDETPDGTSLPPGMLKAAMTTELVMPNSDGLVREGRGFKSGGSPRIKVGPQRVGAANRFGRTAYWVNNGWMLTGHASRSNPNAPRGKRGFKAGRKIREIEGQHFIEKAFDRSAESAVDTFLETLASGLFEGETDLENARPENNSFDVEFG
jgi:hypothetical protein